MLTKNKKAIIFTILFLLVLCGFSYEQISRFNASAQYQPKGSLIDIGSRLVHVDCRGTGKPTIILESGLDTQGSLSWSAVHDTLAKKTRACAYDRAGMMWSDKRLSTTDLLTSISTDLNKALEAANVQPPYILVGHSYGGPYITRYTELYPNNVKGVIFIDTPHPEIMELVKDIETPISVSIKQAVTKVLNPFFDSIGVTRSLNLFNSYTFPNQTNYEAKAVKAFFSISNETLSQEIDNYSKGLKQISHYRDFGDRPLYVLANIVNYKTMSDEQLIAAGINRELVDAVMEQDLYMFNDQASWSSNGKLKLLDDTSHYIQFDKPDEIVKAVEWVLDQVN